MNTLINVPYHCKNKLVKLVQISPKIHHFHKCLVKMMSDKTTLHEFD